MTARRLVRLGCVLAVALATTLATALPANATGTSPKGTTSLASVLAADGSGFDKNSYDYDILDNAVGAVLADNASSPVAVLADGSVPLTAFLPTDRAFRKLVKSLTGTSYESEADVFAAVASLGLPTVENVLLYHVVPGATITYRQAVRSDGAVLKTALKGATIKVNVKFWFLVSLTDADRDASNPYVVQPNINKTNLQIAHGISRVLRPLDLPAAPTP